MKTLTPAEAFSEAPPRSAAVLCVQGPEGCTDMILTDWFTWLNFKRQPMISFSMQRSASLGVQTREGETLYLAFPSREEALKYKAGFRTAAPGQEKTPPDGIRPRRAEGVSVQIPAGTEVTLRCVLANAYNYPFKKVRIFNCNLEEALLHAPEEDAK